MTATHQELQAAMGLRNALARRIAGNAIRGVLPDSISADLYAEYEATVNRAVDGIIEAAKLGEPTA